MILDFQRLNQNTPKCASIGYTETFQIKNELYDFIRPDERLDKGYHEFRAGIELNRPDGHSITPPLIAKSIEHRQPPQQPPYVIETWLYEAKDVFYPFMQKASWRCNSGFVPGTFDDIMQTSSVLFPANIFKYIEEECKTFGDSIGIFHGDITKEIERVYNVDLETYGKPVNEMMYGSVPYFPLSSMREVINNIDHLIDRYGLMQSESDTSNNLIPCMKKMLNVAIKHALDDLYIPREKFISMFSKIPITLNTQKLMVMHKSVAPIIRPMFNNNGNISDETNSNVLAMSGRCKTRIADLAFNLYGDNIYASFMVAGPGNGMPVLEEFASTDMRARILNTQIRHWHDEAIMEHMARKIYVEYLNHKYNFQYKPYTKPIKIDIHKSLADEIYIIIKDGNESHSFYMSYMEHLMFANRLSID